MASKGLGPGSLSPKLGFGMFGMWFSLLRWCFDHRKSCPKIFWLTTGSFLIAVELLCPQFFWWRPKPTFCCCFSRFGHQSKLAIPVSPYRIQNPPCPENLRKLLKNYNLAHPGPVPKITEKLLRSVIFTNKLLKNYTS